MQIKRFNELDINELYAIINLREKVFVVEQTCYYLDADYKDQESWHLMLHEGDELAGYLRILPPGVSHEYCSIGRVVVDENHRRKDYGKKIMKEAISFLHEKFPGQTIKISAQLYLNEFYKSLGFKNIGEVYLEDNIDHIAMILES